MWRRGNPLWAGPLCSMSLVLLHHILAVWFTSLSLNLLPCIMGRLIAIHSAYSSGLLWGSWALASWSIVQMGLDSPRLFKENVFWLAKYISPLVEEWMAQHLTGVMSEGLYRKKPTVLMCWKIVRFFSKYPLLALQKKKQRTKNSTKHIWEP